MTLATKAARGGGAPAGQAAMFGQAAMVHLKAGRRSDHLKDALNALPAGVIIDIPLTLLNILERAGDEDNGEVSVVASDTGPLFESYLGAQSYHAQIVKTENDVHHLHIAPQKPAARHHVARIDLPDDLAQMMTALAAKILVPESDASRLSGAGAGLTDND